MRIKPLNTLLKLGLAQAIGVASYCSLIGLLFWKGDEIFGKVPNYFAPVTFLLLLSVSVMICAALVFYKPYRLFTEGNKKEAADLVIYTTVWLFAFFVIFLLFAVLTPK